MHLCVPATGTGQALHLPVTSLIMLALHLGQDVQKMEAFQFNFTLPAFNTCSQSFLFNLSKESDHLFP